MLELAAFYNFHLQSSMVLGVALDVTGRQVVLLLLIQHQWISPALLEIRKCDASRLPITSKASCHH
jgi:hypothetical protein